MPIAIDGAPAGRRLRRFASSPRPRRGMHDRIDHACRRAAGRAPSPPSAGSRSGTSPSARPHTITSIDIESSGSAQRFARAMRDVTSRARASIGARQIEADRAGAAARAAREVAAGAATGVEHRQPREIGQQRQHRLPAPPPSAVVRPRRIRRRPQRVRRLRIEPSPPPHVRRRANGHRNIVKTPSSRAADSGRRAAAG